MNILKKSLIFVIIWNKRVMGEQKMQKKKKMAKTKQKNEQKQIKFTEIYEYMYSIICCCNK